MPECFNTPLGMTLAGVAPLGLVALVLCWLNTRHTRRLLRRWEVEDQLRALEAQIDEERLLAEAQERRRQFRAEQAAVTREARRWLGLPEEEADGG
jgi:hypothetical protein